MFKIIKALIGGAAVTADPVGTGVKYLRGELQKADLDPDSFSPLLYQDLSNLALRFSKSMSQMSSAEKPVTYFVQHLEYLAGVMMQVLNNLPVEADESVIEVLRRHKLKFSASPQ